MREKRFLSAALAALLCLTLAGCQLASPQAEGQEEGKEAGCFAGFFLTAECLLDSDLLDEDGRIYGQIEGVLPSEETTPEEEIHCVFPGLSGVGFYQLAIRFGDDPLDYCQIPEHNGAFQDRYTAVHADGEDNQTVSARGTLYISPEAETYPAYPNRVYQLTNQEIYLVPAERPLGEWAIQDGDSVSQTYEETFVRRNGESSFRETLQTEVTVAGITPVEKILWTQLDQRNRITARAQYAPGEVPETLIPEKGTAYLIAEQYHQGETEPFQREIITPETDQISTLQLQPEGYYSTQFTDIQWR